MGLLLYTKKSLSFSRIVSGYEDDLSDTCRASVGPAVVYPAVHSSLLTKNSKNSIEIWGRERCCGSRFPWSLVSAAVFSATRDPPIMPGFLVDAHVEMLIPVTVCCVKRSLTDFEWRLIIIYQRYAGGVSHTRELRLMVKVIKKKNFIEVITLFSPRAYHLEEFSLIFCVTAWDSRPCN